MSRPHLAPEVTVESDHRKTEACSTQGTTFEKSPEAFPLTDRLRDAVDTDHYMEPDVETSNDQPNTKPTNPRSRKYPSFKNATANT